MGNLPSGFKTKEEYAKYMRGYRASLKERRILVEHWKEKYVADVRVPPFPESTGDFVKDQIAILDYSGKLGRLLMALVMFLESEKKTRETTDLDDLNRIFREGYEASQTNLKEA